VDCEAWIADYLQYLKAHGYAARTLCFRFKHLRAFERFLTRRAMNSLEEFGQQHVAPFLRYWVDYQPWAKTSPGLKRPSRFAPHHHIAVQYSLRCFLRWAHASGRLHHNPLPLRAPVRGPYRLPQVAEYLHFVKEHKGLAENSLVQIELFVRRLDQFLHAHQVSDWRHLQVQHLDRFVRQEAAHNSGRIQRIHKILRGLLRYLFSLGYLERDWAAALRSPPHYRLARTPRALAPAQVLRMLTSIDRRAPGGKRDFAILLLAASLGVRASEIAGLRLEDLDWKRGVARFIQLKNRHVLHLPLSWSLVKALADYLKNERPRPSPYRHVFLGQTAPRRPLSPRTVSILIARRMRQASITASGHQLRHAFARELLRRGTPFSTLQELLGHTHISSTQVYTKIDLRQLREVADNDGENY
jgi:site-specific recombinase XerD